MPWRYVCAHRIARAAPSAQHAWLHTFSSMRVSRIFTIDAQEAKDYTRRTDNMPGVRRVLELRDETEYSIGVTIFQKPDEELELARGMAIALTGVVELSNQRVALRAFHEGVVRDTSTKARALAEQFRREQWSPAPLVPRWKPVAFDSLAGKPRDARLDVFGFVLERSNPIAYTRKSDDTEAFRQTIELCDEDERCVRATVFLDREVPLTFKRGAIVGLRAAKINEWQGVYSLSVSARGVVFDADAGPKDALRAKAAEMLGDAMEDADTDTDDDADTHEDADMHEDAGVPSDVAAVRRDARDDDAAESDGARVSVVDDTAAQALAALGGGGAPASDAHAPAPAAAAEWHEIQLPDGRRVLLNTRTMQTAPIPGEATPQ